MPVKVANANRVGKARDNPNHSPFLPPPEGRIAEFSLNLFKGVWSSIRAFMKESVCLIVCLGIICVMAPLIPNIMGGLIVKWVHNE